MPIPHKKADADKSLEIVKAAMEHPELYPDPRDLLQALVPYCGRSFMELGEIGLWQLQAVSNKHHAATYELIDQIVKTNAFHLPEFIPVERDTEAGRVSERVEVAGFFYDRFGYVDRADEGKIQARIDRIFRENAADPRRYTGTTLVHALAKASGNSVGGNGGAVNEKFVSEAMGYATNVMNIGKNKDSLWYELLSGLTDRQTNVLHLYNGNEEAYHRRVDAVFEKNGLTQWRPEKLHENALKIVAQIRTEKDARPFYTAPLPEDRKEREALAEWKRTQASGRESQDKWPFYRAVEQLLPEDYVKRNVLAEWVDAKQKESGTRRMAVERAKSLLSGNEPFYEPQRDAMLEVIREHTGLEQDGLDLLRTLSMHRKDKGNQAFSDKFAGMLETYVPRLHGGAPSLSASCQEFAALTASEADAQPPMPWRTVQAIARKSTGLTLQSVRGIVTGFDHLGEVKPDKAAALEKDIAELLKTTPYSRGDLFLRANGIVERFHENGDWPITAHKTRIGQLLFEVMSSRGLDMGLKEFEDRAATPDNDMWAIAYYLGKNTAPVPIKENSRCVLSPDEADNLDRMIAGLQAGLRARGLAELTEKNVAKIRRVAAKSYEEFMRDKAAIVAENTKRSRKRDDR